MTFLNKIFKQKKILVTHDNTFHADDVFATASLSILLNGDIKVIRTRDEKLMKKADFVYDVGGIHDPSINRFDHHQKGGAGQRDNGIPYAAFGLVWKTYGEQICGGSKDIADKIDSHLVQAVDATDNGMNLFDLKTTVAPYLLQDIIFLFRPSWKEDQEYDKKFMEVLKIAEVIIRREIKQTQDASLAKNIIKDAYDKAVDKRLIMLDDYYPWGEAISEYEEPLYVVFPKAGMWRIECVRKEKHSFENRKSLPETWAGKRDEQMAEASGVPDAIFCHNGRFLAVAKSKEGVLLLAEKALLA